ncbi:MAG: Slp family lipoprotein [Pseudomonadota bacterium]
MKQKILCLNVLFVFLAMGCAGTISKQARSQITYTHPFSTLIQNPEKYIGETLLVGGKILETIASNQGSEITVLQLRLDNDGRPVDEDKSEGRFLIRSDQFVDPEIYQKGTPVSLVGKLIGKENRSIGQFDYSYPVLSIIEIKLWQKQARSMPVFHFGIGVGTTF